MNVKGARIVDRDFKNLQLEAEAVAEFPYQPDACTQPYRMVVVRKNLVLQNPPPGVVPSPNRTSACPNCGLMSSVGHQHIPDNCVSLFFPPP
jgi:hypothetical protein